jgi:nitrogen fixation protein
MKLDIDSRIPFPRALVYETYRDHMGDLVPYLPNVKSIEVVERKEADGKVTLKNLWWAKTEIPKVAQSILKPEMLSWYDWATWDQATFSNVWHLELRAMKDVVECKGGNRFVEAGPNACILELRGDLTLHLKHVPGLPRMLAGTLGPTIEKFVVSMLKPNLTEVAKGIETYLGQKK